jgi:hypothetical protein
MEVLYLALFLLQNITNDHELLVYFKHIITHILLLLITTYDNNETCLFSRQWHELFADTRLGQLENSVVGRGGRGEVVEYGHVGLGAHLLWLGRISPEVANMA